VKVVVGKETAVVGKKLNPHLGNWGREKDPDNETRGIGVTTGIPPPRKGPGSKGKNHRITRTGGGGDPDKER